MPKARIDCPQSSLIFNYPRGCPHAETCVDFAKTVGYDNHMMISEYSNEETYYAHAQRMMDDDYYDDES